MRSAGDSLSSLPFLCTRIFDAPQISFLRSTVYIDTIASRPIVSSFGDIFPFPTEIGTTHLPLLHNSTARLLAAAGHCAAMSGVGPRSANTYGSAAPSNYVAGAGRGATGFTTRSDIGPAKPTLDLSAGLPVVGAPNPFLQPQFGAAPAGYVAGRGRGMGELAKDQGEITVKHAQEEADRGDYSESNYDEFSGYGERLFKGLPYEDDDLEADRIYDGVDELMDGRRKRAREQALLDQKKRGEGATTTIADQFADLKRDLASVTAEQWEGIPDVGDHSLKYKQKRRKESYAPVPDFLIADSRAGLVQSIDPKSGTASTGAQTVTGMAEARGTVLSLKLDKVALHTYSARTINNSFS